MRKNKKTGNFTNQKKKDFFFKTRSNIERRSNIRTKLNALLDIILYKS